LEVHGNPGQERRRPSGAGGFHRGALPAKEFGRVGQTGSDDDNEHHRHHREQQQVDRVADIVGQEPAGEHENAHRGTALPSRKSMMRSNRSSSTTKWLMIKTVLPCARRLATISQKRW